MKKTIGILAVLFCLMFVSNALAVNLAWDLQTDCNGFYLYWYPSGGTADTTHRVKIAGGNAVIGEIPDNNFLPAGTAYNIHATAYADPVTTGGTEQESLPSNVISYTYRGSGGNNSIAPNPPTGLTLTGTNFTWVVPAIVNGKPSPVGYNVYYKLNSTGTGGAWSGPTIVTGATLVAMTTVKATWTTGTPYDVKVKSWVWGIDGIVPLESGDSNIFTFTPAGGSGVKPNAPGGLKIR